MSEYNEIVKLAVDTWHGKTEKYSKGESLDVLRKALIEANNGSTKIDYRAIRDGKCNGVFAIVEEILKVTVAEGLQGDEFFNGLVDFRNLPLGDKNEFEVEDKTLFVVSEAADGTQGIRRQRLSGSTKVSIETTTKAIKIYEELNRVLSGQSDFNQFIAKVGKSFEQKILNDIYSLWSTASADELGGTYYYATGGSYSETALLDMIAHVEAAAGGAPATILGTAKALRNLAPSVQGVDSKNDLYNIGYYGSFYGTPTVKLPQRHAIGTTNFVFDDNTLTVIAGDDKPIKFVYEGDPLIIPGALFGNADLTQTYQYNEKYGLGLVLAGGNAGVGKYEITA